MDDLTWIERNYGCFAEYCRQRDEDAEYEAEQQAKWASYYADNKAKLDAARDKAKYFSEAEVCYGCEHYEDVGPASYEDDVPHGICHKNKCDRY